MFILSNKKNGNILIFITMILSFLSFGVFTTSFIIKNQYRKEGFQKEAKLLDDKKILENTIKKIYLSHVEEMVLNDETLKNKEEYILKIDDKEIWEENYGDIKPITDSGFEIEKIYIKKYFIDEVYREIYNKETSKKNNYIGIIRNFSSLNIYNNIRIKLIHVDKTIQIENIKNEKNVNITAMIEIKYLYKGHNYILENIEKLKGEIGVTVY